MLLGCNTDASPSTNQIEIYASASPVSQNHSKKIALVKKNRMKANIVKVTNRVSDIIVAELGNNHISLEELDTSIQLSLFDLEWRKYQLRKQALKSLISHKSKVLKVADQQTKINLTPPTPPRIKLIEDNRKIRGQSSANIMVDVFCSYQSSHCARLQPTLTELEKHYADQIAFRFFDLPQKFHRFGVSAANAVHCASEYSQENKQIWAFQSALYADINQLNPQRYLFIAEQLGIKSSEFDQCLTEKRYQDTISADIAFGKQIGLGNVPAVFINGLYVKGANAAEMYRFYIDQELQQMGKDINVQQSALPIILVATTISNLGNQSTAILGNNKGDNTKSYKAGEHIFPLVSIIKILPNQILIDNKGVTERINIQTSKGHQQAEDPSYLISLSDAESEDISLQKEDNETLIDKPKQRSLPVTGEMTLSRNWLNQQLLDQSELEKHFYKAEHVVEGLHLIKLKNIDNQRFYTSLGLKSDDVIMRVNDQWVHEAQNPLWASLQQSDPVSLVVMRKGLPYRYDYRIE